ncbi:MAG: ABC transporter permease [Geminicoccaceae bacterium]|nr:MAG: ABC transporter permease [Geminicoccaceae bacterium]
MGPLGISGEIGEAAVTALRLLWSADPELLAIVALSLEVSLAATALAAMLGLPLGALLALARFPGRGALVLLVNAGMGLPPVVVGLLVYLLLSRSGPLGDHGLLFTPTAMVIAQTILVTPIVAALARQAVTDLLEDYREHLASLGLRPLAAVPVLLVDARYRLATACLAGFGRAAAEVGAILIVGGNIRGHTRTMTTAIALETSKGALEQALALGFVLILVVLAVNLAAAGLQRMARRIEG